MLAFRSYVAGAPRPSPAPAAEPPPAVNAPPAPALPPALDARTPAEPADAAEAHALTVADRIALLSWFNAGAAGYARFVLETGLAGGTPDRSGYALLYGNGDPWAVLGVARVAGGVLVWHCGSGATHGIYPAMADALLALPPARP